MDRSRMDKANAQFSNLERAKKTKPSGYETEQAAVRANTERLKALRLARDAAVQATAVQEPKEEAKS